MVLFTIFMEMYGGGEVSLWANPGEIPVKRRDMIDIPALNRFTGRVSQHLNVSIYIVRPLNTFSGRC
jgi:hypothetical protein